MKISDTDLQEVVGGRAILDGIGLMPFLKTKCPDCGNVIQTPNKNVSVIICPHCHRCININ